ncbi:MAG: ATP-binding protein [Candidatus Diapherotrites archaeon]|uniref:ATP-binding protein n=1 Tax=Candidatus Iainarchaeum sp. TaxID=3101447 RepID=A0A8T3YKB9_9ARCH|nr:ATP-binding protein [Candidatus Diapherotrites archaeon]
MRFVDRDAELEELRKIGALSRKKLFVVALYGLRRVGKTRLLLEFLKDKGSYFFVNRNKTTSDLLMEFRDILKKSNILGELESIDSWDKFFEVLIKRNAPPIVFDEFQNFSSVEPAVFGIMQKNIDLNENRPGLVILSGSLIGLMKNLFKNSKEPLYGRVKKGIKLEPLNLNSCLELAKELKLEKEELIKFYCVFGGYPKYFTSIEDFGLEGKNALEIIDSLLLSKGAPLEDEVNSILSQEFGGRSGVYYSILEAIANGNNIISTIAGTMGTNPTSITRQIKELRDYFELIELERPFEGKRGIYKIKHPLMQFWFSQIYKNYSDYAARKPEFIESLKNNLNGFYGKAFEKAAKEFLKNKLGLEEARAQWGKIQGAKKSENAYEIDCIGKEGKNTYIFEFKWKELSYKEALSVLKNLEGKTNHLNKKIANAKLGLVAKKIENKQKITNGGYLAYDLEDF